MSSLTVQDLQGILSGANSSSVPMTTQSGNSALNQYFNTAAYQLQNGSNSARATANGGAYNPATAFANDPGVQLAQTQGQNVLENQYAGQGLGQSGALANAVAQNLYTNYNAYNANQGNLFNTYQSQLANLVSQGSANSGAANANSNAQNQASIQAQVGNATSANNQATGSNISSLYSNQGANNASAYLATGAAQSSNLMQGANLYAQLQNNAQASQNQQLTNQAAGQGALAGQTGNKNNTSIF